MTLILKILHFLNGNRLKASFTVTMKSIIRDEVGLILRHISNLTKEASSISNVIYRKREFILGTLFFDCFDEMTISFENIESDQRNV